HTSFSRDWSSDVCSSYLNTAPCSHSGSSCCTCWMNCDTAARSPSSTERATPPATTLLFCAKSSMIRSSRKAHAERRNKMKAGDIMTAPVITIGPDTLIRDIAALLLRHRISGVPVVKNYRVVGLVSEGDLLRRHEIGTDRPPPKDWWW